ncbi:TldD/PmbA family protein [Chloroflexota bacterium]
MEDILSQARNVAEEAEVYMISSEETPVQFEANRLKHIQSKQNTLVALRIIRQGRIGYATATGLGNGGNLVNMAVETAQFGMDARFEFPSLMSYPPVEVFDTDVVAVSIEEMVGLGESLIAKLRIHTPDLVCHVGVSKGVLSTSIINSRGGQANYKQSFFSLGVGANLIRGTDILFVGENQSSCRSIPEASGVAEVALQQLERARVHASAPSRSLPAVFMPHGVAGALIASLMSAFNGKMVLQGASPLGDKLGQSVFDKKFWLWDDPTIAYRPASRPCDDEGIPSKRIPLIEGGVVRSFLYDLQTAALAHTSSTGNAGRGRGRLPAPLPTAFVIVPGRATFEEMVGDMKEGLVIEEVIGAEQGNILGGDFSGNVLLGYKVESGKIVGRVKNTMVSGNVYQLLKNITAIGSDARWVGSSLYTPSLYFSSLSIASK